MRLSALSLVYLLGCTGCTSLALERHTLSQGVSAEDLRYRETLDAVAAVAENPATLPAYASIYAGTAQVMDSAQMASSTIWAVKGFMSSVVNGYFSETANPVVSRNVVQNWSLDPIVVPEKLEAIRGACQWVLFGPERISNSCRSLLASPDQVCEPGRHFGVADALSRLPLGWVHTGSFSDVPACAVFKAHSGRTWVWVCREGLPGLADFSLILQDIARVNSNSPSLFAPPPLISGIRVVTNAIGESATGGNERALSAFVYVDPSYQLVPPQPYMPYRIDNVGLEAHFTSKINAAGAGP
jgi:hypothetical protein